MPQPTARERFFLLLRTSLAESTFTKLTLGKHRGRDTTLNNLFIRPVVLKTGPQLTFVYRHATKDITKNLPYGEAIALVEKLTGSDFLDAHLFTTAQTAQLTTSDDGTARISIKLVKPAPPAATENAPTAQTAVERVKLCTLHMIESDVRGFHSRSPSVIAGATLRAGPWRAARTKTRQAWLCAGRTPRDRAWCESRLHRA